MSKPHVTIETKYGLALTRLLKEAGDAGKPIELLGERFVIGGMLRLNETIRFELYKKSF